jgi:tRNA A37 methylthiotransferase MiaB
MRATGFDQAFMFAYSKRDKTHAARHLEDDVPADVKQRRLAEIIDTFREVRLPQPASSSLHSRGRSPSFMI